MPRSSCRTVDPVELLLRSILHRALLLAGAGTVSACVNALEPDVADTTSPSEDDGGEHMGSVSDSGQPSVVVSTDAGANVKDAGSSDASTRDAGESDGSTRDAGSKDGGADDAALDAATDAQLDAAADAGPAGDAGALGPALSCDPGTYFPVKAAGLRPAQSYDYVAIRRRQGNYDTPPDAGNADAWTATQFQVLSETGTKCATASPTSDCANKVAHQPEGFVRTQCVQLCSEDSVVTTQANAVERWAGSAELTQLLGPIDTPDEALLLVDAAGYDLSCGDAQASSIRAVSDGYEVYATGLTNDCAPIETTRYALHVARSGQISLLGSVVLRTENACIGRKPMGLLSEGRDLGHNKLGDYLARCAHLEAASVVSFERLARELAAHGAPELLIDAALDARADEVRHAEVIGRLAQVRGGKPVAAEVAALSVRTLEEIALENAVEGCVRETFGALVGGYQAQHAIDGALRDAMVEIAEDEARHAALSYHVHRWIFPKLEVNARARVRHAQQRAMFELAAEIRTPIDIYVRRLAGLPSPQMSRLLLDELSKALWQPQGVTRGRDAARG